MVLNFSRHISLIYCGEVKNQIYYEFKEHSVSHCVRRFNKTSFISCFSYSGKIWLNQSELFKKLFEVKYDSIIAMSSASYIRQHFSNKLFLINHIQWLIVLENTFAIIIPLFIRTILNCMPKNWLQKVLYFKWFLIPSFMTG